MLSNQCCEVPVKLEIIIWLRVILVFSPLYVLLTQTYPHLSRLLWNLAWNRTVRISFHLQYWHSEPQWVAYYLLTCLGSPKTYLVPCAYSSFSWWIFSLFIRHSSIQQGVRRARMIFMREKSRLIIVILSILYFLSPLRIMSIFVPFYSRAFFSRTIASKIRFQTIFSVMGSSRRVTGNIIHSGTYSSVIKTIGATMQNFRMYLFSK